MAYELKVAQQQWLQYDGAGIPALFNVAGKFAMVGWVRMIASAAAQVVMAVGDKDATNVLVRLLLNANDSASFSVQTAGMAAQASSAAATITAGTWHHLIGQQLNDTLREIIIDGGTPVQNTTARTIDSTNYDVIRLGRTANSTGDLWGDHAAMELAVFDVTVPFTSDEIAQLAGTGAYAGKPHAPNALTSGRQPILYIPGASSGKEYIQGFDFELLETSSETATAWKEVGVAGLTNIVQGRTEVSSLGSVLSSLGDVTPSAKYLTATDPTHAYRTGQSRPNSLETAAMLRHSRCSMDTSVADEDTNGTPIAGGLVLDAANELWQVGHGVTSGRFYRRAIGASPGTGWELCGSSQTTTGQAYLFRNSQVLLMHDSSDAGNWMRSDDLGDTWTVLAEPPDITSGGSIDPHTRYLNWSFDSDEDGNAVLVEYDDNTGGGFGHLISITHDYGLTWEVVLNSDDDGPWKHVHFVRWLSQRGQFFVTTGDGESQQFAWLIDADSETVEEIWNPADKKNSQPVWVEEIDGDPDHILAGADTFNEVAVIDLLTGDSVQVTSIRPAIPTGAFVWAMFRHAGIYYAQTFSGGNGDTAADGPWTNGVSEILAATDPINGPWTVVHRSARNTFWRIYVVGGESEGALDFEVLSGITFSRWRFMPPATFTTAVGQLILPQRFEHVIGDAIVADDLLLEAGDAVEGTGTGIDGDTIQKFTLPDTANEFSYAITFNKAPADEDDVIQASFFHRANRRVPVTVTHASQLDQPINTTPEPTPDAWRAFRSRVFVMRQSGDNATIRYGLNNPIDPSFEFLLDNVSFQKAPCTPKPSTALATRRATMLDLEYAVPVSGRWASLTAIAPIFNWWEMLGPWAAMPTTPQLVASIRSKVDPLIGADLFWVPGFSSQVNGAPTGSDPNLTLTLDDAIATADWVDCWVTFDASSAAENVGNLARITAVNSATEIVVTNPGGAAFGATAPVDNSRIRIMCPRFRLTGYGDSAATESDDLFGVAALINERASFEAIIWLDSNGDLNCTMKNGCEVNTLGPLTTLDVTAMEAGSIEVRRQADGNNENILPALYHQHRLYDADGLDEDDIKELLDTLTAPLSSAGGLSPAHPLMRIIMGGRRRGIGV